MPLNSLRNDDYSDRELLWILDGQADGDGWATTEDLALALGITPPAGLRLKKKERLRYAKHCTATRYSWMVRYGWVERNPERNKWRLTDVGRDLMNGQLNKNLEENLSQLSAGDRVLILRTLADAYRSDIPEAANMLRREWSRGAKIK